MGMTQKRIRKQAGAPGSRGAVLVFSALWRNTQKRRRNLREGRFVFTLWFHRVFIHGGRNTPPRRQECVTGTPYLQNWRPQMELWESVASRGLHDLFVRARLLHRRVLQASKVCLKSEIKCSWACWDIQIGITTLHPWPSKAHGHLIIHCEFGWTSKVPDALIVSRLDNSKAFTETLGTLLAVSARKNPGELYISNIQCAK